MDDYMTSPFHSPAPTPAMSNAPWQNTSGQYLTPASPLITQGSPSERQQQQEEEGFGRFLPQLPYAHYAIAYIDPVTGHFRTRVSPALERQEDELFNDDFREIFLACVEKRHPHLNASSLGSRISSPNKRTCRGLLSPRPGAEGGLQHHSSGSSIDTTEDIDLEDQSYARDAEGDDVPRVPLAIGDTEKVDAYYEFAFRAFQQINCRQIAKAYIKLIEPRKQVKHPYNGGKGIPGEKRDPEKTKPDWWPEGVAHREPDHLKKPDRIKLLIHIFRNLRKSRAVTAGKLKEAGLDVIRQIKPTDRLNILNEIYRVRSLEEAYEDGRVDGSTTISVTSKDASRPDLDEVSDTESKSSGPTAQGTVRVKRNARKPLRSFDEPFEHAPTEVYDEYRPSQDPNPAIQPQPQVFVSVSNYDSPSSANSDVPMTGDMKNDLARDPLSLRYITVSPESGGGSGGGPGQNENKPAMTPNNGGLSRAVSPSTSHFDLNRFQPAGPVIVPSLGTWSTPPTGIPSASPAAPFPQSASPSAGGQFFNQHRHSYPTAARIASPLSTTSSFSHVTASNHNTAPRMDVMLPANAIGMSTIPSPSPSMTMSSFLQPSGPARHPHNHNHNHHNNHAPHHDNADPPPIKPPKPVHKYGDMYDVPGSSYVDEGYFSPSGFDSKPHSYPGIVGLGVYSD